MSFAEPFLHSIEVTMSANQSDTPSKTPEAIEHARRAPVAIPSEPINYGDRLVVVAPSRYVLLPLGSLITGYTVKAMQRKIERNDWREQREYRHVPDGRVMLDVMGYERWVESGRRSHR